MSRTVSIDEMADAINEGLKEYATLASTQVKSAVRKSAKTVKDQIFRQCTVQNRRIQRKLGGDKTVRIQPEPSDGGAFQEPLPAGSSSGKRSCQVLLCLACTASSLAVISTRTCASWKRAWERMMRIIPTSTCSVWRCSRILAWLMARHADPANVPDSPEEFLDQFNTFSIYQILPQLIELWGLNVQTEVESRKNLAKVSGK